MDWVIKKKVFWALSHDTLNNKTWHTDNNFILQNKTKYNQYSLNYTWKIIYYDYNCMPKKVMLDRARNDSLRSISIWMYEQKYTTSIYWKDWSLQKIKFSLQFNWAIQKNSEFVHRWILTFSPHYMHCKLCMCINTSAAHVSRQESLFFRCIKQAFYWNLFKILFLTKNISL